MNATHWFGPEWHQHLTTKSGDRRARARRRNRTPLNQVYRPRIPDLRRQLAGP